MSERGWGFFIINAGLYGFDGENVDNKIRRMQTRNDRKDGPNLKQNSRRITSVTAAKEYFSALTF